LLGSRFGGCVEFEFELIDITVKKKYVRTDFMQCFRFSSRLVYFFGTGKKKIFFCANVLKNDKNLFCVFVVFFYPFMAKEESK